MAFLRREERAVGNQIEVAFAQTDPTRLVKIVAENIGRMMDLHKVSLKGVEFAGKEVAALL